MTTLGKYRLIAELGHGGMADVFLSLAEGPAGMGFAKLAVVKKLRSHLAEDPDFVAMLMDEARVSSRLSHPNVVQLFELVHEGDELFLAMEYLDGQPLHRVLKKAEREGRPFSSDDQYAIVCDVLAGLHYAHELADYDGTHLQIVHRDVTPHNIFVTYDGVVKVVDFGIAKAAGRATETKQGIIKGKVRYMSPEQAAGEHVDRRTDIFAAGVLLWNAATGTRLWGSLDDYGVIAALLRAEYDDSPRAVCPDVPEAIDAICRKALAFDRADRYETAEAMRLDIEEFLAERSAVVRRELGPTMRELFTNERAKLRRILSEASAAHASGSSPVQRAADPQEHAAHTVVMPDAPPRPSSLPVAAPEVVAAPASTSAVAAPPSEREHSEPRKPRSIAAIASLALAACLLVAGGVAIASRMTGARIARTPSTAVTDRESWLDPARARAAGPPPPVESSAPIASNEPARDARSHKTHKSAAPSARNTPAPPVKPAVAAPATAPATPGTRSKKQSGIDNADPWTE